MSGNMILLKRYSVCIFAAVAIVIAVDLDVFGHGEIPPRPPTPPQVPPQSRVVHVKPPRWSWVHWWEANRDRYLEIIRQGRDGQKASQDVIQDFRRQAVEALTAATQSEHWQLRASAALALGRMSEAGALERLADLAAGDKSGSVRLIALIALGLLNSPEAETFLISRKYDTPEEKEAALVAIGLLETITLKTEAGLQKTLQSGAIGPATMAAWALRYRTDPGNAAFLNKILAKKNNCWLASEAILSLGGAENARGVVRLGNILLATDAVKSLPAWAKLEANRKKLLVILASLRAWEINYETAHEDYLKKYKKWYKDDPNAPGPSKRRKLLGMVEIIIGRERIYKGRLRASAGIALGGIPDARLNAARALREVLTRKNNDFNDLPKGMAIMSLGELGDVKSVPILVKILKNLRVGKWKREKKSPLRGYAALALGLYSRPETTPQGTRDRPQYEKVCRLLAERMADSEEIIEVRTAAALALGLSGRTENLKLLQQASRTIGRSRKNEEILVGYTLLARGMLGDKNIIPIAKKFLKTANDRRTVSGILSRRAAVLGLGVLGDQEAIPILNKAWHLNHYVNREVALAYSLCEAYNATEPLLKLLNESENPRERAFAARCLGELFTAARPQRLSRLIANSNYTMKNKRMIRYQALGNEFLFVYLIPAFGEEWR